jgi:UDP-N-acetylmuramyl pentapeptide phosphotransferase/UDP-N-acetylglucosamine-1-phosphate transferase
MAGLGGTLLLHQTVTVPSKLRAINHRRVELPMDGGIALIGGLILAQVGLVVAAVVKRSAADDRVFELGILQGVLTVDHWITIGVIASFFLLGLADDLSEGLAKGFRGHIGELVRGKVTGGAVKAFGGVLVGVLAAYLWGSEGWEIALDGFTLALVANLSNLLDVRPGRSTKVFLLSWVALAAVGWSAGSAFLPASAAVAGGAIVWVAFDLRERGMLGDSGANLLGACVGSGVVLLLGTAATAVVAVIVGGLTIISERWSFSDLIDRLPPLRWFDTLGAKKAPLG